MEKVKHVVTIGPPEIRKILTDKDYDTLIYIVDKLLKEGVKLNIEYDGAIKTKIKTKFEIIFNNAIRIVEASKIESDSETGRVLLVNLMEEECCSRKIVAVIPKEAMVSIIEDK